MDSQEKPKKKWYLRWWMIVIYVLLALSFIGTLGSKGTNSTSTGNTQSAAPVPALTVTAFKMAADYKENEVAADAKYKDKFIEISGTVDTIGKDALDTPFIAFETLARYFLTGRWRVLGSVLYNYFYFGILFLIGLIWGPEVYANDYFPIVATIIYVVSFSIVGFILLTSGIQRPYVRR